MTSRTKSNNSTPTGSNPPVTRSRRTSAVVEGGSTTGPLLTRKGWNHISQNSAMKEQLKSGRPASKSLWTTTPNTPARRPLSSLGQPINGLPKSTPSEAFMKNPLLHKASATSVDEAALKASLAFGRKGMEGYDPTKEPIKAYLRIRPPSNPTAATGSESYIKCVNETEILMVPPADHRLNPSSASSTFFHGSSLLRSSAINNNLSSAGGAETKSIEDVGSVYKFTRVFGDLPTTAIGLPTSNLSIPSAVSQADFFLETALPLVHDFLAGQNCLLFAYGPTGSGKTWTVQGGEGENAGLLPRVMDVVWRSLQGQESKSNLRPSMLAGVEIGNRSPAMVDGPPMTSTPSKIARLTALHGGAKPTSVALDNILNSSFARTDALKNDPLTVPVDDQYEYAIWVSYAEIYNEKIYDLLDSPQSVITPSACSSHSTTTSSMFQAGLGLLSVGGAKAKAMMKGIHTVKRNALSLKHDKAAGNKYVHGMQEVRVHSSQEARALLDRGQVNRRVFSTLANRESSRSHSVFTIKIIRVKKGSDPDDTTSATASRFSIVDLAGSERVVNTQTTGDRLKEAGNINQSLMVLGQCMEVLRKNQEREKGRKPAIVPYRHSKLTELFQSFFDGDGKAAMIVNVNPYETSFDENTHVMKFSAVAKGVMTLRNNIPVTSISSLAPRERKTAPQVVRLSMVEGEEEQDVLYEEEEALSEDDEEEDEFVNALLEELSVLRTSVYEARMEKVMAESQARARTVLEYEKKLLDLETHYQERMREEAIEAEHKLNAKLDILTRLQAANLANTKTAVSTFDDSDDEELSDLSDTENEVEGEEDETEEEEEAEDGEEESGEVLGDTSEETANDEEVQKMLLAEDDGTDVSSATASPLVTRMANVKLASQLKMLCLSDDNVVANDKILKTKQGSNSMERFESRPEASEKPDNAASLVESSFEVEEEEEEDVEESDEYEEEEDDSEEEYIPVRRVSSVRKPRGSSDASAMKSPKSKKAATAPKIVTSNASIKEEEQLEVNPSTGDPLVHIEEEDQDDFAMDRSLVVTTASKSGKKPKRKLGGRQIKDADDIESIAETLTPVRAPKSLSNASIATSVRSLKR